MSDDKLEDWEYTDNQLPDFDKSAADVLNLVPDMTERLNGFLKNQYCRSLVQVSWKNTLIVRCLKVVCYIFYMISMYAGYF